MAKALTDRCQQILEAIIEEYIATAQPVGSKALTQNHGIKLSPASVRNVMAELEDLGYLASPTPRQDAFLPRRAIVSTLTPCCASANWTAAKKTRSNCSTDSTVCR